MRGIALGFERVVEVAGAGLVLGLHALLLLSPLGDARRGGIV